MSAQTGPLGAGRCIPDPDRPVAGTGDQMPPIRCERDGDHRRLVTAQAGELGPIDNLLDPSRAIVQAASDHAAVRREGDVEHLILRTETSDFVESMGIPDPDRAIGARGGDARPIPGDGNPSDRAGMPVQGGEPGPAARVPGPHSMVLRPGDESAIGKEGEAFDGGV